MIRSQSKSKRTSTRASSKNREAFMRMMRYRRKPNCDSESYFTKGVSNRLIYLSVDPVRRGPEKPKALALAIGALDRRRSNPM